MFIVESYGLAVALCWVTMLCWGSWGNTQKLSAQTWRYELFYWDYVIGILLFSLVWGLTLGSIGEGGRGFMQDLQQVGMENFWSAFLGGRHIQCLEYIVVGFHVVGWYVGCFPDRGGVGVGIRRICQLLQCTEGGSCHSFWGCLLDCVGHCF